MVTHVGCYLLVIKTNNTADFLRPTIHKRLSSLLQSHPHFFSFALLRLFSPGVYHGYSLPDTKLEDLCYVASEVCSHVERAVSKHEKQVSSFKDKYAAKHKYTALIAGSTLGVTMLPILAPFLGALLPLGLAPAIGKYVSDKLDEKAEGKGFSHSMMGVISLAKGK